MDRFFTADTAMVVSEIIDGEAIMLHRGSGIYFSTDGVGGLIWQWIGEGRSRNRILAALTEKFATPQPEMEGALDSFLTDLAAHDLIRETAGADRAAGGAEAPLNSMPKPGPTVRFVAPRLHVYQDIRKLLLLDPLHDVAEMAGWPTSKPTDATN